MAHSHITRINFLRKYFEQYLSKTVLFYHRIILYFPLSTLTYFFGGFPVDCKIYRLQLKLRRVFHKLG